MRGNPFLQALALATQLGFAIACPMLVFIGGGAWLDGVLHTAPWLMLLGVLLGILVAGGAIYQLTTVQTYKRYKGRPQEGATPTQQAPYKVERESPGDQKSIVTGTNRAVKPGTRNGARRR